MYGNYPIKFVLMGVLCITCIVTTPFYFLIMRFEKNCHYRTLVNQMISSAMYTTLTHNTISMPLTMYVYFASPLNSPTFCKIYLIIHNIGAYHCLMLLDAMLIVKFIFVHFLKNPTAVQDDFWNLFLNMWVFGFQIITQTVIHTLPGKNPIRISTCIGKVPQQYINVPFKNNWPLFIVLILSILSHIGFFLFEQYLKHFGSNKLKDIETSQIQIAASKNVNMHSFFAMTVAMLVLVGGTFTSFKMTAMHPTEIDIFPNYLFIYFQDLFISTFSVLSFLLTYLYKHDNVRKIVWRELKSIITCTECS